MEQTLTYFLYFIMFMFGASVASFICVVVGRGSFANSLSGRSLCSSCNTKLAYHELIPVFSYIFLRGKCSHCKVSIPDTLVLTELALGLWFVFSVVYATDILILALQLILGSVLVFLAYEDVTSMEVSSSMLYLLMVITILNAVYKLLVFQNYDDVLISLIISLPFWLIWLVNKNAVGEADPYIFTGLNLFFGTQFSVSLFLYSIWFGTVYSLVYLYLVKGIFERTARVPFIPAIYLACLFILIFDFHIVRISDILLVNEFLFK